jgi:outer membrane protein assembly factor BamE
LCCLALFVRQPFIDTGFVFSLLITDYLPRPIKRMILSRFFSVVLLAGAVSACSSVPRIINEYKIDVQQGNVLTQEMVSQLRPGLSRDQVRFILGTPMLADMFHADRWDYVYRLQKGKTGEVETRKFSTFFGPDGKLVRVAGDVVPTQTGAAAAPESRSREIDLGSIPADGSAPASPDDEKGFFSRAIEKVGF